MFKKLGSLLAGLALACCLLAFPAAAENVTGEHILFTDGGASSNYYLFNIQGYYNNQPIQTEYGERYIFYFQRAGGGYVSGLTPSVSFSLISASSGRTTLTLTNSTSTPQTVDFAMSLDVDINGSDRAPLLAIPTDLATAQSIRACETTNTGYQCTWQMRGVEGSPDATNLWLGQYGTHRSYVFDMGTETSTVSIDSACNWSWHDIVVPANGSASVAFITTVEGADLGDLGDLLPDLDLPDQPGDDDDDPTGTDTNGDGIVDAWDTDGDGIPDKFDTNGDGTPDAWDTNGDGRPDAFDTNGDGVADAWDTNGDGVIDAWDTNGDGIPDKWDTNGDGVADAFDTNGDGRPDAWDTDGDGVNDDFDANGDGIRDSQQNVIVLVFQGDWYWNEIARQMLAAPEKTIVEVQMGCDTAIPAGVLQVLEHTNVSLHIVGNRAEFTLTQKSIQAMSSLPAAMNIVDAYNWAQNH